MIIYTGLPRSGTNLLKNILSQNNNLHVSHESSLPYIVHQTIESVKIESLDINFNYIENEKTIKDVLESFVKGGISHVDSLYEGIHINHSKAWLKFLLILLDLNYKVILSVRNMKDIFCSFEKQRNEKLIFADFNKFNIECSHPFIGKIEYYLQTINALNWGIGFLNDICLNVDKYKNNLLIVRYEDLISSPENILNKIYSFIGCEKYNHDFNNIPESGFPDDHIATRLKVSHIINKKLINKNEHEIDSSVVDYINKRFFSIQKLLGYY